MPEAVKNIENLRFEKVLSDLYAMQLQDLEQLVEKATALLEKRKSPKFSEKEQQLIQAIEQGGLTEEAWERYDLLAHKLEEERMSETEQEEFMQLNTVVEQWSVERLKLVVELADLWNTSIEKVFDQLSIQPRKNQYA